MPATKKPAVDPALGPQLRELCAQRRISHNELARRSGLSPNIVRRILQARRAAQPSERRCIARALGVKIRELTAPKRDEPNIDTAAETARRQVELERDELRAQVDQLRQELAIERAARSAEIAELRDQHMRELAVLRTRFHDEQVKALGEAQEREEKLATALHVALVEIDRHVPGEGNASSQAYTSDGPKSSVAETIAGVAVGLGGFALTTLLLRPKRC